MAKNIKKRSASHIYFGVNKLTGELKHISEVPSGQKCNCIYNCIYDFTLFCSCFSEVDAGGFYAFMPHEISQERYIITAIKEALGESVTE